MLLSHAAIKKPRLLTLPRGTQNAIHGSSAAHILVRSRPAVMQAGTFSLLILQCLGVGVNILGNRALALLLAGLKSHLQITYA